MDGEILFSERQKFRQWWLWLILSLINGFLLFGVFKQVIKGQPFGSKPIPNTGLLIITGLMLLLMIMFLVIRLETLIKKEGIYVRFFPFHLKFRYYSWDRLIKLFVRKYSPFSEYGGWGIRIGLRSTGKAYNISGNKGLQLEFTDNKKLLIGTNKPDELTETLKSIGQLRQ